MSIADLLMREGVRVKSGAFGDVKTTCPKCSHLRKNKADPCLSVTIERDSGVWFCHHCSWTGGVNERAEWPHERRKKPAPVKPSYVPQPPVDGLLAWFEKRNIRRETVEAAKISRVDVWMPNDGPGQTTPAIAFPFFRGGEVVNVKYRSKDKRFRQEKGAQKVFYGLETVGDAKTVYITEGEIDALSLREAGLVAISVPDGAPKRVKEGPIDPENDTKFSFVWECRDELAHVEKFVLAVDADAPGQALAEELARRFGREKCWRVAWTQGCKDANEVLCAYGLEEMVRCVADARPWPIQGIHEAEDYRDEVMALYRVGRSRALSTGWATLDEYMTIAEGQLSVVTGIPNSGKSEWVDALMVNLAEANGWSFAVCSFENPPAEHLSKLAEKRLRAPFWDGPTPRMTEQELSDAITWANDHFTFIRVDGDKDSPTMDWVLEKLGAAVMRHGVRGCVIDPWNEIEHSRPSNMTETEYIGQALAKIKRFAAQRGVHVWVVAHPRILRANAEGVMDPPSLYDIAGSANWANKADVGVVVFRNQETGLTDIYVRKVRFKSVGQQGNVSLRYDRATGRYSNNDVYAHTHER